MPVECELGSGLGEARAPDSALTARDAQAQLSQELSDMSTVSPGGSCLDRPVVSKCNDTQLKALASRGNN